MAKLFCYAVLPLSNKNTVTPPVIFSRCTTPPLLSFYFTTNNRAERRKIRFLVERTTSWIRGRSSRLFENSPLLRMKYYIRSKNFFEKNNRVAEENFKRRANKIFFEPVIRKFNNSIIKLFIFNNEKSELSIYNVNVAKVIKNFE